MKGLSEQRHAARVVGVLTHVCRLTGPGSKRSASRQTARWFYNNMCRRVFRQQCKKLTRLAFGAGLMLPDSDKATKYRPQSC